MTLAICINCGAVKKRPVQECHECHFRPHSDEEKARSLMLSTFYEIRGEYRGKTRDELMAIRAAIREKKYRFDPQEVAAVVEYASQVTSIPASRLATDFLKWFGLPVLILVIVFFLLWATR